MKRLIIVVTGLIILFASCVSLQDREMTANEQAQAQVLGKVSVQFHSWQFMHIINAKGIKSKVYQELLKEARLRYEGSIDVRNITITGGWSGLQLLNVIFGYIGGGFLAPGLFIAGFTADGPGPLAFMGFPIGLLWHLSAGNTQKITAVGEVVSLPASAPSGSAAPVPSDPPGSAPAPGANF